MNLRLHLSRWWLTKRLRWANRWAEEAGLCLAKIEHRAGTDYILDNRGRWRRIGR